MTTKLVPAWDLIGHEGSFRVPGGRTLYEGVMYSTSRARGDRVRLARLQVGPTVEDGLRQINRYVDADQLIEVLVDHDERED